MVGRCRCNAFTTLSPPSSFIGWNSNAILMGCVFFMLFCMCGRVNLSMILSFERMVTLLRGRYCGPLALRISHLEISSNLV